MKESINRYKIDNMPGQSGEPVGVYIRRHSEVLGSPHIHDCYEIEIIINGTINESINLMSYSASRGDAYLLTPNDFHKLDNNQNVEIYNIMFKEDVIHKRFFHVLCEYNLKKNIVCHFDEDEFNYIQIILDRAIVEYKQRHRFFENIMADTINIIISMMLRKCNINLESDLKDNAIRKAMLYMQLNCNENLTLKDVAKEVGLSTAYFSDKFHREVGVTFKNYLNELKLNRARQSLIMTDLSIAEIGFMCGFNSLPSFYREFKRAFGISPQSLRDNYISKH